VDAGCLDARVSPDIFVDAATGFMIGLVKSEASDVAIVVIPGNMEFLLNLPDELSAVLAASGQDLSRAAFEAIALETYRENKLSTAQLRRVLGYQTRAQVHAFLKQHGVYLRYDLPDLEHDRQAGDALGPPSAA
jgi:hypothetical protein